MFNGVGTAPSFHEPVKRGSAGKPSDEIHDHERVNVRLRGSDADNHNILIASQVDPSGNQDEQVLEVIETPQEINAGRHFIRASPFTPSADVSTRSQDDGNNNSNKHSTQASSFAIAKESAVAKINKTKTRADKVLP